jgi:hypothetical protein
LRLKAARSPVLFFCLLLAIENLRILYSPKNLRSHSPASALCEASGLERAFLLEARWRGEPDAYPSQISSPTLRDMNRWELRETE